MYFVWATKAFTARIECQHCIFEIFCKCLLNSKMICKGMLDLEYTGQGDVQAKMGYLRRRPFIFHR